MSRPVRSVVPRRLLRVGLAAVTMIGAVVLGSAPAHAATAIHCSQGRVAGYDDEVVFNNNCPQFVDDGAPYVFTVDTLYLVYYDFFRGPIILVYPNAVATCGSYQYSSDLGLEATHCSIPALTGAPTPAP
jgi:hypothetical protein